MKAHAPVKNGPRYVVKHATPKFPFVGVGKVFENIHASAWPENFVAHHLHMLNEWMLAFVCRLFGNLNGEINQPRKLHVVRQHALVIKRDLTGHGSYTGEGFDDEGTEDL